MASIKRKDKTTQKTRFCHCQQAVTVCQTVKHAIPIEAVHLWIIYVYLPSKHIQYVGDQFLHFVGYDCWPIEQFNASMNLNFDTYSRQSASSWVPWWEKAWRDGVHTRVHMEVRVSGVAEQSRAGHILRSRCFPSSSARSFIVEICFIEE